MESVRMIQKRSEKVCRFEREKDFDINQLLGTV